MPSSAAGAWSAWPVDDEALDLMVRHGTWWCPTLSVYIPETPDRRREERVGIV